MTVASDICGIIRAEAEERGLSGNELSRRSGLCQTGVAKLLRGEVNPHAETVVRLLAAMNRNLAWLHHRLKDLHGAAT
jgi:transcriptional regulator with XRE-family HTH domain